MSDLVSISLSHIPFLNTCDASRLQMVSKYFGGQALPHLSNEIPKLLSIDSYKASIYSDRFIKFAKDDGYVVYTDEKIMMVYYRNINDFEIFDVPEYKKVSSHFATRIRNKLRINQRFKKGDILYEYAGFSKGIPSAGINARVAFMSLGLMNYEDAIIISESMAKKFKSYVYESFIVPVYTNSILRKNSKGKYLPDINEEYRFGDVIISIGEYGSTNLVDYLLSVSREHLQNDTNKRVNLINARVVNVSIYRFNKNKIVKDSVTYNLLQDNYLFQRQLIEEKIKEFNKYIGNNHKLSKYIMNKYYDVTKVSSKDIRNKNELVFLVKIDVVYEEELWLGDKLSTRGANKGVISAILPDELMPVDEDGNRIDIILSPFAIPSRMNINQIYEVYLTNLVEYAEKLLLSGEVKKALQIILDIQQKFGKKYYVMTKKFIDKMLEDDKLLEYYINDVRKYGLYIVVDDFKDKKYTKQDILDLYEKYNIKHIKNVVYNPRKISKFILGSEKQYLPRKVENQCLSGLMYIYRLFKISRYLLNARSTGPYHKILKVPTRGRSKQGGSRIGNNELDMLLTFDSKYVLKEFITIKADDHEHKIDFINSVIQGSDYFIKNITPQSYTNLTISSLIKTMFIDLEESV